MKHIKNLILGGGIAGIAASYFLKDKSNSFVFESETNLGGLCNSFQINGFMFDTAVHLSFTNLQEVKEKFNEVEQIYHAPKACNFYNNKWVKHPVQNNLFILDIEDRVKCIRDFVNRPNTAVNNYEDWLLNSYGVSIYNLFHKIYTSKYWCNEPKELTTNWVGNRLSVPSLEQMLYGAMSEDTPTDYYAKEMRYPAEGGYYSFIKPLTYNLQIETNKKAIKINAIEKIVFFEDGTLIHYEKLISSIPLPEIIKLIINVPSSVQKIAQKLAATSVALVSVGLNKQKSTNHLWFYIYDEDILASRVNIPSNKSPSNAPKGCSSLQFEIYFTDEKPLVQTPNEVMDNVKYALFKMNICKEEDILFMDYREKKYANVIFYHGMEQDRDCVINYLRQLGIEVIGRFGEWDYLWSDQSFLSGMRMAKKINEKV